MYNHVHVCSSDNGMTHGLKVTSDRTEVENCVFKEWGDGCHCDRVWSGVGGVAMVISIVSPGAHVAGPRLSVCGEEGWTGPILPKHGLYPVFYGERVHPDPGCQHDVLIFFGVAPSDDVHHFQPAIEIQVAHHGGRNNHVWNQDMLAAQIADLLWRETADVV